MYLYLEPIFTFEDISKNLENESRMFASVNKDWKDIMYLLKNDPLVLNIKQIPDLLGKLRQSRSYIEQI